jgi:ribosome-associated heat shock protein Hsp15
MITGPQGDKVRLDRWLWAARFFKTRSLAAEAVDGGKIQVNGARVKRSKLVEVGDVLRIRKPPYEFTVEVREPAQHRPAAKVAQGFYEETPESLRRRELLRQQLKHQPSAEHEGKGRPTKRDRRRIERFKRGR